MINAANAAGTRLMVGESYFFSGPHVLAADLIKQGQIGEVQQVRINKAPWIFTPEEDERLDGGGHDPPWRFDPVLSGGGTPLYVLVVSSGRPTGCFNDDLKDREICLC